MEEENLRTLLVKESLQLKKSRILTYPLVTSLSLLFVWLSCYCHSGSSTRTWCILSLVSLSWLPFYQLMSVSNPLSRRYFPESLPLCIFPVVVTAEWLFIKSWSCLCLFLLHSLGSLLENKVSHGSCKMCVEFSSA